MRVLPVRRPCRLQGVLGTLNTILALFVESQVTRPSSAATWLIRAVQFKEAIEAAVYPVLEVTLGDQSHGTGQAMLAQLSRARLHRGCTGDHQHVLHQERQSDRLGGLPPAVRRVQARPHRLLPRLVCARASDA